MASDVFDADSADYCDGVAIDTHDPNPPGTEQWARASLEDAPLALRWFIVAGWRYILRLRLGPRHSLDHILGWRIVRRLPDETVLELRSNSLSAHLVFRRDGTRIAWSTFVHYDRRIAAFVWPPVSLVHRRIVPLALRLATSRISTRAE
ncbi:MAG: hypothetical protein ACYDH6_21625 [Acidimicrobiales bacterium]